MFCFDEGYFFAKEGAQMVCSGDCVEDLYVKKDSDWGAGLQIEYRL